MDQISAFFEKAVTLLESNDGALNGHSPITQFAVSHIPADFDVRAFTRDLNNGLAEDHAGKADVGYLKTGHAYLGNKLFISFDTPQPFAFTIPVVGAALHEQAVRQNFRLSTLDIAVSDAPSHSLDARPLSRSDRRPSLPARGLDKAL